MNADIAPFLAPRTKLVDELIARLQRYHIIRVRGTPASGKTTLMRLVANKLFEKHGKTTPIHVLTGWKYDELRSNWESYLEKVTGVHGRKYINCIGWLHEEETKEGRRFVFASPIHCW